jgi:hypothetical protein
LECGDVVGKVGHTGECECEEWVVELGGDIEVAWVCEYGGDGEWFEEWGDVGVVCVVFCSGAWGRWDEDGDGTETIECRDGEQATWVCVHEEQDVLAFFDGLCEELVGELVDGLVGFLVGVGFAEPKEERPSWDGVCLFFEGVGEADAGVVLEAHDTRQTWELPAHGVEDIRGIDRGFSKSVPGFVEKVRCHIIKGLCLVGFTAMDGGF